MENRQDLETLLLDGLPEAEQQLVIDAMKRTTAAKLRDLRASETDDDSTLEPEGTPIAP